ncbi:MAG: hypothetical protein D6726_09400 [Nitrospirae bacterium]|nr:MAG: hypothetical protein D6726_09400 [Nitrospirota bacterium]
MMKKKVIIGMILLLVLEGFCTTIWGAGYGKKPFINISALPDLTVTAKIIKVDKYKNSDGGLCYRIYPYFTITNNGGSVAKHFNYVIEFITFPWLTWQNYTLKDNVSLAPGSTIFIDGTVFQWHIPWCADNFLNIHPGWQIRVDTGKAVAESNEHNNTAVVHYYQLGKQPPVSNKPSGVNK